MSSKLADGLSSALSLAAMALAPARLHPEAQLKDLTDADERYDGWTNTTLGFGTSRDKSGGTYYIEPTWLTDPELTALFNHNDLAYKCVALPVKEALKCGFSVCVDDDPEGSQLLKKYLKKYRLVELVKSAKTWGRLFGGCVLWLRTAEKDPSKPLPELKLPEEPAEPKPEAQPPAPKPAPSSAPPAGSPVVGGAPTRADAFPQAPTAAQQPPVAQPEPANPAEPEVDLETPTDAEPTSPPAVGSQTIQPVIAIEVIDRRYLSPFRYYPDGPKIGRPMTYQMFAPRDGGGVVLLGEIHETRLVVFGGAQTEAEEKRRRRGWDASVLQRVYEALQSTGNVWKSIEILTADANQAVYKISKLWRMVAGDPTSGTGDDGTGQAPRAGILNRIRLMDLFRSVGRAIVLDKDEEDFQRTTTTFTGLPELSERQWVRVAAAAEIPLPLLTGEYPSGLQSNGEGPFRVFNSALRAEQEQEYEPLILELVQLLLRQPDAPKFTLEQWENLEVDWPPLWEPTAEEIADIRLKRAQEADTLITAQVITPEEAAVTIAEESGWDINHDLRAAAVEAMTEPPAATAKAQEQADKQAQLKALGQAPAPGTPGKPGTPNPGASPFPPGAGGTPGTPKAPPA